jgi:hypothetical protein
MDTTIPAQSPNRFGLRRRGRDAENFRGTRSEGFRSAKPRREDTTRRQLHEASAQSTDNPIARTHLAESHRRSAAPPTLRDRGFDASPKLTRDPNRSISRAGARRQPSGASPATAGDLDVRRPGCGTGLSLEFSSLLARLIRVDLLEDDRKIAPPHDPPRLQLAASSIGAPVIRRRALGRHVCLFRRPCASPRAAPLAAGRGQSASRLSNARTRQKFRGYRSIRTAATPTDPRRGRWRKRIRGRDPKAHLPPEGAAYDAGGPRNGWPTGTLTHPNP